MIQSPIPCNVEAEEHILGGILLDPNAIERIIHLIVPEAFYVLSHQTIYQAAQRLYQAGKPTDLMTVSSWLYDQKLLDSVGGTAKLAQLVDRTVAAISVDSYAELVMDKYIRRRLITAGHEIAQLSQDTTQPLDSILNESEQKIFQIANQRLGFNTEHNSTIAANAYNQLDQTNPIYTTGLYELDHLLVGFEPKTLTLLAGRPSMGKSQIALFLAVQMMLQHHLPVIFFSLEMTKQQLEYRLWSLLSILESWQSQFKPLTSDRIRLHRSGKQPLSNDELENIVNILGLAVELPLYINDSRGITVSGIASECRQVKSKEGKLGLVIIDYLQMMAEDSGGNRSYELGDVARGLYKLAADVDVPVLALSQINRAVETRNNKRPTMSDLSQSGILEMVADNVLLAYRDEYYNPETPNPGILELILAKARHGQTGTVVVHFDRTHGFLKNLAK
jgi:replicative DNA helicase